MCEFGILEVCILLAQMKTVVLLKGVWKNKKKGGRMD